MFLICVYVSEHAPCYSLGIARFGTLTHAGKKQKQYPENCPNAIEQLCKNDLPVEVVDFLYDGTSIEIHCFHTKVSLQTDK